MTHFMIDVETSGLNPGENYITSCAVVPFDLDFEGVYQSVYHERFDCPIGMRARDDETTKFRVEHGIDRAERRLDKRPNLIETLHTIKQFIHSMDDDVFNIYVWAKPSSFDIAFLESYYRHAAIAIPWHYRNVRDLGTYLFAAGHKLEDLYKEIKMTGDAHNALHDARYQIILAQLGYRNILEKQFALLACEERRMPEGTKLRYADKKLAG